MNDNINFCWCCDCIITIPSSAAKIMQEGQVVGYVCQNCVMLKTSSLLEEK